MVSKIPPHSTEVEESLLGSLLIDREANQQNRQGGRRHDQRSSQPVAELGRQFGCCGDRAGMIVGCDHQDVRCVSQSSSSSRAEISSEVSKSCGDWGVSFSAGRPADSSVLAWSVFSGGGAGTARRRSAQARSRRETRRTPLSWSAPTPAPTE